MASSPAPDVTTVPAVPTTPAGRWWSPRLGRSGVAAAVVGLVGLVAAAPGLLGTAAGLRAEADRTTAPVHVWWDDQQVVGTSTLVRTPDGISARFSTTGLTEGHAVTLWAVVVGDPGACSSDPCAVPGDVFASGPRADMHAVGGGVVGGGRSTTVAGELRVGATDASGRGELGLDPVPLDDPVGAEVVLALQDHGPAGTGSTLVSQLESFLGGCTLFRGPDGYASGPGDVPDGDGECSVLQRSWHP